MTEHERRVRYKTFVGLLTTWGYALAVGAVVQPMISTGALSWRSAAALTAGLAFNGLAVYIAPRGEKP